jgi:hypothetical protein
MTDKEIAAAAATTTNQINQVMVWISTVTAALAIAGMGYVFSELGAHSNRLTSIEASRYTLKDHIEYERAGREMYDKVRIELQTVKDRVKDLESN